MVIRGESLIRFETGTRNMPLGNGGFIPADARRCPQKPNSAGRQAVRLNLSQPPYGDVAQRQSGGHRDIDYLCHKVELAPL